jgi:hypothetical protein
LKSITKWNGSRLQETRFGAENGEIGIEIEKRKG